MGNLGSYQTITTDAKIVGGPLVLLLLVFLTGLVVGIVCSIGAIKAIKMRKTESKANGSKQYTAYIKGKTKEIEKYTVQKEVECDGQIFHEGDVFIVLGSADKYVSIAKYDEIKTHYVSAEWLSSISDFKRV